MKPSLIAVAFALLSCMIYTCNGSGNGCKAFPPIENSLEKVVFQCSNVTVDRAHCRLGCDCVSRNDIHPVADMKCETKTSLEPFFLWWNASSAFHAISSLELTGPDGVLHNITADSSRVADAIVANGTGHDVEAKVDYITSHALAGADGVVSAGAVPCTTEFGAKTFGFSFNHKELDYSFTWAPHTRYTTSLEALNFVVRRKIADGPWVTQSGISGISAAYQSSAPAQCGQVQLQTWSALNPKYSAGKTVECPVVSSIIAFNLTSPPSRGSFPPNAVVVSNTNKSSAHLDISFVSGWGGGCKNSTYVATVYPIPFKGITYSSDKVTGPAREGGRILNFSIDIPGCADRYIVDVTATNEVGPQLVSYPGVIYGPCHEDSDKKNHKLSGGEIAGIAVAAVAVLVVLGFVARRRRQSASPDEYKGITGV